MWCNYFSKFACYYIHTQNKAGVCVCVWTFFGGGHTHVAYGGSQARGPIRAEAASLHHNSWQGRILNSLSKTRDRTPSSWMLVGFANQWATTGTPKAGGFIFYSKQTLYLYFFLFRATPWAYGGSQARGLIGATAAGLHHNQSNVRSKPHLWPIPQLMAILDP